MQAAVMVGEHGQRGVVAHGADRLLGVLDHGVEDELQVLHGHAEGQLPAAQLVALVEHRFAVVRSNQVVDLGRVADPLTEGMRRGQTVLELGVVVEPALLQVDRDHLAGPEAALFQDPAFVQADHAGLGAGEQQAVLGDRVAQRPEAVAVHAGQDPAPAVGADRGRPVPGLHDRVAVTVQVLVGLGHRAVVAPGLGDQQGLGHGQVAPGAHHELEDVIEGRRIRGARLHDRLDVLHGLVEGGRSHAALVRLHPVDVALEGVDLAVVGEHPERLRQMPGREGVGRIALVEDGEAGDEALVQ